MEFPRMRLVLLLILVFSVGGCGPNAARPIAPPQSSEPASRFVAPPKGPTGAPRSPIEFLEFLKQSSTGFIEVWGENRGWIQATDIEPLMRLIDSEAPCAGVMSVFSSHIPPADHRYTVGHEAAMLIEGFRRGYYPPTLSSDLFEPDRRELKNWYQDWKQTRKQDFDRYPVNSSDNRAVIRLEGDDVVYREQKVELWRVPVKSIAVIGEYTTANGPYVDDYFFVFVTTPAQRQFHGSFYAEGWEDLLTALSRRLLAQLECGLCHSTDLDSCCLWPPALEGKPLFRFTRGPAGEGWARLQRFLSPHYSFDLTTEGELYLAALGEGSVPAGAATGLGIFDVGLGRDR